MVFHVIKQAISTLLSRLSGLIRDVVTAYYLGADRTSDAFFASFRVPNSIRKLIGEGPLSASFVPIFIDQSIKNKKRAREFAGTTLVVITLVGFIVATVLFIFMDSFLSLIVPGLINEPEVFATAVRLSRVSVPFMGLTCCVAVLGGITNANQSFFSFGITPMILNFSMIGCVLVFGKLFPNTAFALSFGIVLGGMLQILFMLRACQKIGMLPIIKFKNPTSVRLATRKMFTKLVAIVFGQGIFQINMFVDGIFASFTAKTQSYLYYSERLSQFVITLIGHTLGMVSLPMLSMYIKKNKPQEALQVQNKCISWLTLWSIPAAVSLFYLSHDIVKMIYCRGSFLTEDVFYVGNMLKITCCVIPIYAINKILYSSIYSLEKVGFAVIAGLVAVSVNLAINLLLINRIQHYYVVISSAVSAVVECAILLFVLKYKYKFLLFLKKDFVTLLIVIPVSFAVGSLSFLCFNAMPYSIWLKLLIIIPITIFVYTVIVSLFGIINIISLLRSVKKHVYASKSG
ncbi:MAG: murein biosynthesis integral membrane protein MurJ [Alphaproteobacteria bacterium]|nr:murein biosynthesis integral membrane protein MurJ [Rickettsiales bacterium]